MLDIRKVLRFNSLFFLLMLGSCLKRQVTIEGELPIDSIKTMKLVNYMTGKELYVDTVVGRTFELQIDSVPDGVYKIIIEWNRHVMKAEEIKTRQRHGAEQEPAKFYLVRNIWIDDSGKHSFEVYLSDSLTQSVIEQELMTDEYNIPIIVAPNMQNAKLYEAYLNIGQDLYRENIRKKDSLRTEMYALIGDGELGKAKEIDLLLKMNWLPEVKVVLEKKEVEFLKEHNSHMMIPYVLYGRVRSKTDFNTYREVYEGMNPKVKEKVSAYFEGIQ